ncbi:hypothetical protein RFI_03695, partial [Reticulomyxa filosa]
ITAFGIELIINIYMEDTCGWPLNYFVMYHPAYCTCNSLECKSFRDAFNLTGDIRCNKSTNIAKMKDFSKKNCKRIKEIKKTLAKQKNKKNKDKKKKKEIKQEQIDIEVSPFFEFYQSQPTHFELELDQKIKEIEKLKEENVKQKIEMRKKWKKT